MMEKYDEVTENPRYKDVKEEFDVSCNFVTLFVKNEDDLEDCAEAMSNLCGKELAEEPEFEGTGDYLFDYHGAWLVVTAV